MVAPALSGRYVVRVGTVGALGHVNAVNGFLRIKSRPVLRPVTVPHGPSNQLRLVPVPALPEELIIVLGLKVEHDSLHDFVARGVGDRRGANSLEHRDDRALL